MPGSHTASGFREYGKEEGCRRLSLWPHSVPLWFVPSGLSPLVCPLWFVPSGLSPAVHHRGQMPGSRMASGFGRYVKEEGCRRLSLWPHSVPLWFVPSGLSPLVCPLWFVPSGLSPAVHHRGQMPGSRMASGFGRYVKEEGCRRLSPQICSRTPILSPALHNTGQMSGSRTASGFRRYVKEEGCRRLSPEGQKGMP